MTSTQRRTVGRSADRTTGRSEGSANAGLTAAADGLPFSPADERESARVYVVAEIGVNHDGQLAKAIDLVEAAKYIGADAIKLQLFDPRLLLSRQAVLAEYQKASDSDVFAMLDRLKLGLDDMLAIRAATRRLDLDFVVTPFSMESHRTLESLEPDVVKIASPDAVNLPLLDMAASLGRPMIVSTGTAYLDELAPCADRLRRHDAGGCLLHCVSSYPTPDEQASLGAMQAMAARFGLPVGYSDHTDERMTGALAVAAGACVIEKHLTYDRTASGPDHAASFDPRTFGDYVAFIRRAATMMGPRVKKPQQAELEVRSICRQSVCACRDLDAGHVLTRDDLTVKRPGLGIPAAELPAVVGRRLIHAVRSNDLLKQDDLAA